MWCWCRCELQGVQQEYVRVCGDKEKVEGQLREAEATQQRAVDEVCLWPLI